MKPDTSDTNYVYAEGKDALTVFGDSDEKVQVWIGDGWADRLSKSQAYCRGDFYRKPKHLVKQSFSIYEAPIRGSANEMEHRCAIMKAAWEGREVEESVADRSDPYFGIWWQPSEVAFLWEHQNYRIKKPAETTKPKIAQGHNPNNLTEDQVGVKDGWRLLSEEEIADRDSTQYIEARVARHWLLGYCGHEKNMTYRTKKPTNYYLPNKKELKPWTFETAPKGCVLMRTFDGHWTYLVTGWKDRHISGGWNGDMSYKEAAKLWRHSLDGGKTWMECGTYE